MHCPFGDLKIVVEIKLVRGRALLHRDDFAIVFVLEPRVDHIFGEDITSEQELMVFAEIDQSFVERFWRAWDLGRFFGRESVDVLIERIARVDFVHHTIKTSHQHGGERQVRFEDASGVRYSMRLALGLVPVLGMRIEAERLRYE